MDKKRIIISLLDKVMKLQKNGHYAAFELSNHGSDISIYAMKGGFRMEDGYDFSEYLMLTDSENALSTLIQLDEIIEEWGKNNNESVSD